MITVDKWTHSSGESGWGVFDNGRYIAFGSTRKMATRQAELYAATHGLIFTPQPIKRKKPTKRKNPLPVRAKLAKALALRAGFRSTAGTHKDKNPRVKTVTVRGVDGVQIGIGKVAAIEYTLVDEKGKPIRGQAFRHEFTGRSQPMLTASHDGKQLYFVGGQYRFKTDGINDI